MTSKARDVILAALRSYRGDNYERAKAAFRSCTAEQMQQEYGFSGETRQAILDGYKRHVDLVEEAIREVQNL